MQFTNQPYNQHHINIHDDYENKENANNQNNN